jgi:hypothetical protein
VWRFRAVSTPLFKSFMTQNKTASVEKIRADLLTFGMTDSITIL